jgi:hypothetical protein
LIQKKVHFYYLGDRYNEDEDHLALMIETLGLIPKKLALSGK